MSKRIVASFTLASYALLGIPVAALPLATAAPSATIEAASGKLSSLNAQNDLSPKAGSSLAEGSVLRTGKDGQAILVLPGGDRVRLAPDSELTLTKLGAGVTQIKLHQGRLLGSVTSGFQVQAAEGTTRATNGEFVLEVDGKGAGLKVLSGDAHLGSAVDQPTTYAGMSMFPAGLDMMALLGLDDLSYEQSIGGFAFGGGKGKGIRVRSTNDNESVGGLEDASPDQDVAPPPRKPPTVYQPVEPPPVVNTPPPVVNTPPPVVNTPPPVNPAPAAVGGGGAGIALGVLGALGLAGLIIALNNDDNDNVNFVGGGNNPPPSPALP